MTVVESSVGVVLVVGRQKLMATRRTKVGKIQEKQKMQIVYKIWTFVWISLLNLDTATMHVLSKCFGEH